MRNLRRGCVTLLTLSCGLALAPEASRAQDPWQLEPGGRPVFQGDAEKPVAVPTSAPSRASEPAPVPTPEAPTASSETTTKQRQGRNPGREWQRAYDDELRETLRNDGAARPGHADSALTIELPPSGR